MFFFFNDTATTEIYTLSLHDALPIWADPRPEGVCARGPPEFPDRVLELPPDGGPGPPDDRARRLEPADADRKSTRLNSSHANISYAVFCLKKKNIQQIQISSTHT